MRRRTGIDVEAVRDRQRQTQRQTIRRIERGNQVKNKSNIVLKFCEQFETAANTQEGKHKCRRKRLKRRRRKWRGRNEIEEEDTK